MSENGFARTFSMFEKFSSTPWLSEQLREEYRSAWACEGRMQAMLQWYAKSPIIVPNPDENAQTPPLYGGERHQYRISMKHLLIWGENDQALLTASTRRLPEFCDDLTVHSIADGDHWLLHSHGKFIADSHQSVFVGKMIQCGCILLASLPGRSSLQANAL